MFEQIMKRLISIISYQASSLPPNAQNPNFTIFVFTQFHSSYVTLLTGFFIGSCIEICRGSIQLTEIKNVLSPVNIFLMLNAHNSAASLIRLQTISD